MILQDYLSILFLSNPFSFYFFRKNIFSREYSLFYPYFHFWVFHNANRFFNRKPYFLRIHGKFYRQVFNIVWLSRPVFHRFNRVFNIIMKKMENLILLFSFLFIRQPAQIRAMSPFWGLMALFFRIFNLFFLEYCPRLQRPTGLCRPFPCSCERYNRHISDTAEDVPLSGNRFYSDHPRQADGRKDLLR